MNNNYLSNSYKKNYGFTMIEMLVVVAIIGTLSAVVAPKLIKEMRKSTMTKVQHNLGIIESRLSYDETFLDEFPDLVKENKIVTDLSKAYSINPTPGFTNSDGVSYPENDQVVDTRDYSGGWYYDRTEGEIYANLPNGAYTYDEEYEIWNDSDDISEIVIDGEVYSLGDLNKDSGSLDTGNGNDVITIDDDIANNKTLNTNGGDDTVIIGEDVNYGSINTGDGDDTITIIGDLGDVKFKKHNSHIDTGTGDDTVDIGVVTNISTIDTGEGDDMVTISTVDETFGAGYIKDGVIISYATDDIDVDLGTGDDTLTIDYYSEESVAIFDGGEGDNDLILNDVTEEEWNNGINEKFINFNTVTFSNE